MFSLLLLLLHESYFVYLFRFYRIAVRFIVLLQVSAKGTLNFDILRSRC